MKPFVPIHHDCQSAKLIKATRYHPEATNGLITVEVEMAYWVQDETNRTSYLAPNIKSHRTKAYSEPVNHYEPIHFYMAAQGMTPGAPAPAWKQFVARALWRAGCQYGWWSASIMNRMGLAYEHSFRMLHSAHMVKGVYTATENGWRHFLALRSTPNVDKAMLVWVDKLRPVLSNIKWEIGDSHLPYGDESISYMTPEEQIRVCAARVARMSFGEARATRRDLAFSESLSKRNEWSPFEQTAIMGHISEIRPSRLNSNEKDRWGGCGWQSGRNIVGWNPEK